MPPDPTDARQRRSHRLIDALLVVLGTCLTLSIYGYRYGEGNHTIYLLDALRGTDPQLLRNDWFTTQTLQYHALFGWISQKLMQWHVIEPAFLAGYLLLILLFHIAWLRIVGQLSLPRIAYPVSLVLYYASAAGTGLGFYQFFQDSSFLPSNVANVAMLWGFCLWIAGKSTASGACFGLAGLFHLNHAVVGIGIWIVLCLLEFSTVPRAKRASLLLGSVRVLLPSLINIALAAKIKLQRSGSLPLEEFVALYVRLRHPHHYDPSTWPVWLWLAALWQVPPALAETYGKVDQPARRRVKHIFILLLGLQIIALIAAGAWFFSETLIQLSLYRFSIFIQLLGCILAAGWLVRIARSATTIGFLASAAGAIMIAVCLLRGPFFGAFVMPADDHEYGELCDWARRNTAVDSVFLVSPSESSFRLHAQRAIVVNFKAVPQLSGELKYWRQRMCDVLAMQDLHALPRGYQPTIVAIADRYDSLSSDELIRAAREYGCDYIVSMRALEPRPEIGLRHSTAGGRYFLYDVFLPNTY